MAKDYSDISVDLDLDDGRTVTCDTITVLEVDGKRYIALAPREDNADPEDAEIWFYGLEGDIEDEDKEPELIYTDPEDAEIWFFGLNGDIEDEDKEPELIYIDDDETYDAVIDAFDEYLDELDFEELDD